MKNTRLFGLFHTSDPSLSRDNSRVVEVIVDDLNTGLGPSRYPLVQVNQSAFQSKFMLQKVFHVAAYHTNRQTEMAFQI